MMKSDPHPLSDLVAAELAEPVDPRVSAMAAALAAHYGDASRVVLFYGPCLRMRLHEGLMLDFYLIVSDYRAAYGKRGLPTAKRLKIGRAHVRAPVTNTNLECRLIVVTKNRRSRH